jgi:hypothetical protein
MVMEKRFSINKSAIFDQDRSYICHPPEGLQAGGLNPPDPVGIPCPRIDPADMSFFTSPHPHSGQIGTESFEDNKSDSNTWQQPLH